MEAESSPDDSNEPIKICGLNPNLTCVICSGYLISAVTIVECLHSFCRSCIIRFLRENPHNQACPICDAPLHKTKPILSLRPDKTLQDIVYKLVPGLYARELNQRKRFYFSSGLGASPIVSRDEDEMLLENEEGEHFYAPDDKISLSLEYALWRNQSYMAESVKALNGQSDNCQEEGDDQYQRRYLLCPASLSVLHLKKFIYNKFHLSEKQYSVDLMYQDELLEPSLKLLDIAYIFCWRRNNPMRLFYRIGKKRTTVSIVSFDHKEPSKLAKVVPLVQESVSEKQAFSPQTVEKPKLESDENDQSTTGQDSDVLSSQEASKLEEPPVETAIAIDSPEKRSGKESISVQCNIKSKSTTSALRNVRINSSRNPNVQPVKPTQKNFETPLNTDPKSEVELDNDPNKTVLHTKIQISGSHAKVSQTDSSKKITPSESSVLKRKSNPCDELQEEGTPPKKISKALTIDRASTTSEHQHGFKDLSKTSPSTKFHMRNILGSSSPPPVHPASLSKSPPQQIGSGDRIVDKLHVVPTTKGVTIVRESAIKTSCSVSSGPSEPLRIPKKNTSNSNCLQKRVDSPSSLSCPNQGPKMINTPLKPSTASLRAFQHYFSAPQKNNSVDETNQVGPKMTATEKVQQYLEAHIGNRLTDNKIEGQRSHSSGKPNKGSSIDRIVAKIMTKNGSLSSTTATNTANTTSSNDASQTGNSLEASQSSSSRNSMSPKSTTLEVSENKVSTTSDISPRSQTSKDSSNGSKPTSTGNLVIRISTKGSEMTCTTTSPILRSPGSTTSNMLPTSPDASVTSNNNGNQNSKPSSTTDKPLTKTVEQVEAEKETKESEMDRDSDEEGQLVVDIAGQTDDSSCSQPSDLTLNSEQFQPEENPTSQPLPPFDEKTSHKPVLETKKAQ